MLETLGVEEELDDGKSFIVVSKTICVDSRGVTLTQLVWSEKKKKNA